MFVSFAFSFYLSATENNTTMKDLKDNSQQYCLILAGGTGSRLWPLSRADKPKQFLDFFGTGRSLLQQTYDRFARFMDPDHIFISTNQQYLSLVQEQLPDVPATHILAEPIRRGTLASVVIGSLVIAAKRDAQANIVVTPADQLILTDEIFRQDIQQGLRFAAQCDGMITMGIRPTRPETAYGYIQAGEDSGHEGFYHVRSFTEKPAEEFARMFVEMGEFYWNAGLFLFNVQVMLKVLTAQVPEYQVELPRLMAEISRDSSRLVPEFFTSLPNLSVDAGVLERNDKVYVQEGHFGWADLGTWESLQCNAQTQDINGNLLIDTKAYLHDCRNNVIHLPKGVTAVVDGLQDYVIVEQNGILLIAPKNNPAGIRRLMTQVEIK